MAWATELSAWVPFHADEWYDVDTGEPKDVAPSHVWDLQCAGCHATGVEVAYNSTSGEWTATWEEPGVTCELCHGLGSTHVKPPSGEDKRDYIWYSVSSDLCGNCHAGGTSVGMVGGKHTGYPMDSAGLVMRPGEDLADFFVLDPTLHPDGETASGQAMQYNDYLRSRHSHSLPTLLGNEGKMDFCLNCHSTDHYLAEEGAKPDLDTAVHDIECVLCHDMHGTEEVNNLRLGEWDTCVQCHRNGDIGPGTDPLPAQKEVVTGTIPVDGIDGDPWMGGGVVCTDCHMPTMGTRVVQYDIPSHTWHFISPAKSIDLGMPNSCTVTCHRDGSPEGALTDEEALAYVEDARAAADVLIASAEANLSIARARLDVAEALGFSNATISAANDTMTLAEWALAFILRDASRAHNPDFYEVVLTYVVDSASGVYTDLTPASVRGTVLDGDGKAVAGAEVRGGGTVWATTGSEGTFQFYIAPGTYTFEVYEDGKLKKAYEPATVAYGPVEDLGELRFDKEDDDGPGFGAVVAVLSTALAVLVLVRARARWT
jgi:predicted CXXCH cytochrome family protein